MLCPILHGLLHGGRVSEDLGLGQLGLHRTKGSMESDFLGLGEKENLGMRRWTIGVNGV